MRHKQKNAAAIQREINIRHVTGAEQRRHAGRRRLAGHLQIVVGLGHDALQRRQRLDRDSVWAFVSRGAVRNAVLICSKNETRLVV